MKPGRAARLGRPASAAESTQVFFFLSAGMRSTPAAIRS